MAKNVDKALEAVQLDINKEYGDGSIMRLGGTANLDVEAISTGCLSLRYGFRSWRCTKRKNY